MLTYGKGLRPPTATCPRPNREPTPWDGVGSAEQSCLYRPGRENQLPEPWVGTGPWPVSEGLLRAAPPSAP